MDIDTDFDLNGQKNPHDFNERWGVNNTTGPITNPYLSALIDAASRGVKVRLLLDGSDFNGDGIPENRKAADSIIDTISRKGLEDLFEVRLHPSSRMDLSCAISLVHTKGMIVDGSKTWISSFNWGPTSGLENREMGLLIESDEISGYYRKVFLHDWGGTLQDELTSEIRLVDFDMAGNREYRIEIGIDMIWKGKEDLSITLMNRENDEVMGELGIVEPGFEGIFITETNIGNVSDGDFIILQVTSGDRTLELYEIRVESDSGKEKRTSDTAASSSLIPILIIAVISILFSIARMAISEIRTFRRTENRFQEE
jgi:hypothetical protein